MSYVSSVNLANAGLTGNDPIADVRGSGQHGSVRLSSITANRHIFDGQANGKPLRLLLNFDGGRTLRLQISGNGEQIIADDGPLDAPFDMDEYGRIDIADVTRSLFPSLQGVEVTQVETLALDGKPVGVTLGVDGRQPFHIWVGGDELHWGDGAALSSHDWLHGAVPTAAERIEV